MSNLIFNIRVYKWHFQISRRFKPSVLTNEHYNYSIDPFIKVF